MVWRANQDDPEDDWSDDAFAVDHDGDETEWDDADDDSDDDGSVACPACGAAMYEDAPQCPSCGIYPSREQYADGPKPRWVIAGAVLCLLIALTWFLLLM